MIYARYINGESIKTDGYLYTEWFDKNGVFYGRMLYDHQKDPDENVNISEIPGNKALVDSLKEMLHKEIKSAVEINL